ncbi:MAG TPA: VOC family protein [Candidatus Baltobacteraceae bacterium]|nr:VOC family protein [Candidatus Baltobacteraceae bacterium]
MRHKVPPRGVFKSMKQQTATFTQTLFPGIRYRDAREAIAWLEEAFGAEPHVVYDAPDGTVAHAELYVAGNLLMLGTSRDDDYPVRSPQEVNAVTAGIYVVLPDATAVDALFARAEAAGAPITHPPHDTDYGSHDFRALDLEGHPWTFGTYKPGAHS